MLSVNSFKVQKVSEENFVGAVYNSWLRSKIAINRDFELKILRIVKSCKWWFWIEININHTKLYTVTVVKLFFKKKKVLKCVK